MTRDPRLYFPSEGSHTQDFYALKKSIDPGRDRPANLGSRSEYDNHWTTGVDCTKEEQRSVIRFLWSEGVSGVAIHLRLSSQCGNSVLSQRSFYEWIEKLKNGRTNVMHDKGAGRPSMAITEDYTERACDMVLLDK